MVSNCRGKLNITRSFLPTLKKLLVAMEIVCQVMGKKKKSTFFFSVKEERLESGEGKSRSTGNGTFPPRTGHIFLTFHLHGVSPPTLSVCDRVPSRVFCMGSRHSRATNLSQICISLLCSTQSIMSHCCLFLDSGLNCISPLCTEQFHHPSPLTGTSPGWLADKAVFWWNT